MSGLEELRVLLVEDTEQDMPLLKRTFEGIECDRFAIDWATSIKMARAKIANKHHDVVLVYSELTDSCCLEIVDKLHKLAPHVPLVVLTEASSDTLATQVFRYGAQDYLSKDDLSPQVLLRTMLFAVERHCLLGMIKRNERLALVRQLSAGVAHELNSPLAHIMTELGELRLGLVGNDRHYRLMKSVDRTLERVEHIRQTVRSLHLFSTSHSPRKEYFDATKAVQRARRLADISFRYVTDVREDIQHLPRVRGDQGRYTQAILDLLTHVSEVSRRRINQPTRVWLKAYERSGIVVVAIEDEGPVMSSGHPNKLLEPYGTDRMVSMGRTTGLVLAAVRDVAREHGGGLEIMNSKQGGVRFEFRVPKAEVRSMSVTSRTRQDRNSGHRAKILWIDDDVSLLRAFQRRLSRDHDVDVCASAIEALSRIDRGERWDVICCDLMMPETNGREFEEILSARYPALAARLIFVTGGGLNEEERKFLENSQQPKLLKPFDWDAFLQTVEEIRA